MKKVIKYGLIVIAIIIVAMVIVFNIAVRNMKEIMEENPLETVDFSRVKDGVYTGVFDARIVSAEVEVTILEGRMTNVKLLSHNHGKGYGADDILPVVLENQTLEVDLITGATGSSKVVLKAIENALRKGLDENTKDQ